MTAPRDRRPVTGGPLPGLEGLRVLDLSDDVAGAYCAKLLSDAGATVTRVEQPGGHSLRRWSVHGDVGSDGDADGALFRFLASSHESVVLDFHSPGSDVTVAALAATADVAILSTFGGHGADTTSTVDPHALQTAHPELVVVSLSAFGLTGPPCLGTLIGVPDPSPLGLPAQPRQCRRPPAGRGGALAEWSVGTYGALGAVERADGASTHGPRRPCGRLGPGEPDHHVHLLPLGRGQHARWRAQAFDLHDDPEHRTLPRRLRRNGDHHDGAVEDLPRNDRTSRPGRR